MNYNRSSLTSSCRYGVRGGFIGKEQNKTVLHQVSFVLVETFTGTSVCVRVTLLQLLRSKASVPGVGTYSGAVVENKKETLKGGGGLFDETGEEGWRW